MIGLKAIIAPAHDCRASSAAGVHWKPPDDCSTISMQRSSTIDDQGFRRILNRNVKIPLLGGIV
ncbi:MAG TPA: hypothetical protein VGD52_16540, partial [Pseudoduganella sp.]